jgi:hypothetical protein
MPNADPLEEEHPGFAAMMQRPAATTDAVKRRERRMKPSKSVRTQRHATVAL